MKRDERRAAVKGKDIIYIYHDTIDASSHNDETTVFNACYSANHEIKNLVNMICSELNGLKCHYYIRSWLLIYIPGIK